MKNRIFIKSFLGIASVAGIFPATLAAEKVTVKAYDEVVFYDGYNGKVFDADKNDGVLRFSNSHYSVKLNPSDFDQATGNMVMNVDIGALCDNYDRIGNLNLAFVPKGQDTYVPKEVGRIEITRFITPFMNKNKDPKVVPYEYNIPNVAKLLRDVDLRSQYDFWLEFELFGIPYAANTQVAGCKDRNDVFAGTVTFSFEASEPEQPETGNVLVPIYIKTPEHYGNINLNNYNEQATDTLGVTTRTFEFNVPEDVADSRVYLILTNHGAATGGEEYVRREHLIYFDGEVVLTYKPGGVSCEPYRKYNTQANGIYGSKPDEKFWTMQSNWCPGQAVPIREIHMGAVKAGKHSVMIRVPKARFYQQDGDFRPSIYFQGVTSGDLPSSVDQVWFEGASVDVNIEGKIAKFDSNEPVVMVTVHSYDGMKLLSEGSLRGPELRQVSLEGLPSGAYILTFYTDDGRPATKKVLLK